MTSIILILLFLICIGYIVTLVKGYCMCVQSSHTLVGLDASFNATPSLHTGFVVISFDFDRPISQQSIATIQSDLLHHLTNNPSSSISLWVNHTTKQFRHRPVAQFGTVVKNIVHNKPLPAWGKWDIATYPVQLFIYNKTVSILFNHQYHDGHALATQLVFPVLFKHITPKHLDLPHIRYQPLVTEYLLVKSLVQTLSLPHSSMQSLHVPSGFDAREIDVREIDAPWTTKFMFSQDIIKSIKATIALRGNGPIRYSAILMALSVNAIFESTRHPLTHLNIMVLMGVTNELFFNNFGSIMLTIDAPDAKASHQHSNPENTLHRIQQIAREIDHQLVTRRTQIPASYIGQNLFTPTNPFNKHIKQKIDCLFSIMPFTDKELFIGDATVIGGNLHSPYLTAPMYAYCPSWASTQCCSFTVNTPVLVRDKFSTSFRSSIE